MISSLLKLGKIVPSVTIISIAYLFIGIVVLGSSAIAETESENSSDIFSEPIRNELPKSQNGTEAQPGIPADIPGKTRKKPAQIGDIIEVNPSSQNWDLIHSGDLNRGTVKFRLSE